MARFEEQVKALSMEQAFRLALAWRGEATKGKRRHPPGALHATVTMRTPKRSAATEAVEGVAYRARARWLKDLGEERSRDLYGAIFEAGCVLAAAPMGGRPPKGYEGWTDPWNACLRPLAVDAPKFTPLSSLEEFD